MVLNWKRARSGGRPWIYML